MDFIINDSRWYIEEISDKEISGKDGYYTHGYTCYSKNTIYLNETSLEKERTLKHELTHCWLYMYGHNQDDKRFTNEDVCEIVASINSFINDIVDKYIRIIERKERNERTKNN